MSKLMNRFKEAARDALESRFSRNKAKAVAAFRVEATFVVAADVAATVVDVLARNPDGFSEEQLKEMFTQVMARPDILELIQKRVDAMVVAKFGS